VRDTNADPMLYTHQGPGLYDGLVHQTYLWSPAFTVGGPSRCFEFDALGSVFGPRLRYDAFGNGADNTTGPFTYVGEFGYYDDQASTTLYSLWHRWYDPTTGRFVSRDPIARQGVTAYPYVGNSPTRWVDAAGLRKSRGFWGDPYTECMKAAVMDFAYCLGGAAARYILLPGVIGAVAIGAGLALIASPWWSGVGAVVGVVLIAGTVVWWVVSVAQFHCEVSRCIDQWHDDKVACEALKDVDTTLPEGQW
jgi:RHS repeat-associated protein